jgi:hypothetical protein
VRLVFDRLQATGVAVASYDPAGTVSRPGDPAVGM